MTTDLIPVIDFSPFIGGDAVARAEVARQMRLASADWGFFYLSGCGMPADRLAEAFSASKAFFALPDDDKQVLAWRNAQSNRGYVGVRRERLDPSKPGDLKEAFNLAPCSSEGADNQWPAALPGFRSQMEAFLEACIITTNHVLEAFAVALNQPDDFFVRAHDRHHHVLRLLHYPPLPSGYVPQDGESRAGAHTDYGSITLLFQDDVGGLQVCTRKGQWVAAPSIPGTVVVNTGDLMHRWTNQEFCSTPHRVSLPSGAEQIDRYSIAFFGYPNHDTEIACIESCASESNPPRYAPISAGNHLLECLNSTY